MIKSDKFIAKEISLTAKCMDKFYFIFLKGKCFEEPSSINNQLKEYLCTKRDVFIAEPYQITTQRGMEDIKITKGIFMKETGLKVYPMVREFKHIEMEILMKASLLTDKNLDKEFIDLLTEKCIKAVFI